MIHSKQHGVQNSGPWDPWLPLVENSRLIAQRGHSARCAWEVGCGVGDYPGMHCRHHAVAPGEKEYLACRACKWRRGGVNRAPKIWGGGGWERGSFDRHY